MICITPTDSVGSLECGYPFAPVSDGMIEMYASMRDHIGSSVGVGDRRCSERSV